MLNFIAAVYVSALFIRPAEIVPVLEGVPVMDILTGVSAVVALGSLLARPRRVVDVAADFYILLFWVAIVLSNLAWGWFGGAYWGLLDFAPVVFTYFLIRLAVDTPARLRRFLYLLVALNVLLAINGIVQYHTGVGAGRVVTIAENRIRGTGIFNDPNDLGLTLVMTVPFLLMMIGEQGSALRKRFLALVLLAPLVTAIVYTNSRGAALGLSAVCVMFALRRFRMLPGLAFGAAAVLAVLMLGPSRAQAMTSQESSAQSRIEAWGQGLMMMKSQPVFGVGYGRFTEFHRKVAHNSFVHTAAELGLFGSLVFVAMFDRFFKTLKRARMASQAPDAVTVPWLNAFQGAGVGLLICGFFLSRQYVVVPYVLLALGGSIDTLTSAGNGRRQHLLDMDAIRVPVLTMAVLLLVYAMVRTMGAW